MAFIRCTNCGRPAPGGASFCPACGIQEPAKAASERPWWPRLLDHTWDFFASVKVAIWLIGIIAVASIAGSLIEQEGLYQDWRPPEQYYPWRYGIVLGNFFLKTQLTRAYTSWWYLTLIGLLAISLIVCSLQRLIPLWRALQAPEVKKSPAFLSRQAFTAEVTPKTSNADPVDVAAALLKRQRYQVRQEGNYLHGDRGRLSRLGPYILHVGLLVIIFGAATRAIPGFDLRETVWVADGEAVRVPGTDYSIRSEGFIDEYYPDGRASLFQTTVTVLDKGQEITTHELRVNHPLAYGGVEIYQASFRKEWGWANLVIEGPAGYVSDPFEVDLRQPDTVYEVGDLRVVVEAYYADFAMADGQPINQTREVANPVFYFVFVDADGQTVGSQVYPLLVPEFEEGIRGPYQVSLARGGGMPLRERAYSGLFVVRDRTVPYVAAGGLIVLLGLGLTFFLFHRQVWLHFDGEQWLIGARTNKDKHGLKKEMQRLIVSLGE